MTNFKTLIGAAIWTIVSATLAFSALTPVGLA